MLKNFIGSGSWKLKGVLALGLLVSSGAWALPLTSPTIVPFGVPVPGSWTVDDGNEGFPAGPWTKILGIPTATQQGNTLPLNENLNFIGGPGGSTLTSWTETIQLGSEWIWFDGSFTVGSDPAVLGDITNGGLTITFTNFGPLVVAEFDDISFTIVKHLRCENPTVGDTVCVNGLTVVANAVPEPGTLLLLAGGLAGLAGLRRRRYS